MAGLTTTGWETPTFEELEADIQADLLSNVSDKLNLSATSFAGQIATIVARKVQEIWDAEGDRYAQLDADQATDTMQDILYKLSGVFRQTALATKLDVTVNVDAGTYPAGSLIVYQDGKPSVRFSNFAELVAAVDGDSTVTFVCDDTGVINPPTASLDQIADPITGFNSATNPGTNVALGQPRETNAAFRVRWAQSLAKQGSATVDAIRSELLELEGVRSVVVLENDGDVTDANGTAAHGVQVIIQGGSDDEIALTLWQEMDPGTATTGSTTETIHDSQGVAHDIHFTHPTAIKVWFTVVADVLTGVYVPGSIQSAIQNAYDVNKGAVTSKDLIYSKVMGLCANVLGVVDVTTLFTGTSASPSGTVNIVIDIDEIMDADLAHIDVTENFVSAAP